MLGALSITFMCDMHVSRLHAFTLIFTHMCEYMSRHSIHTCKQIYLYMYTNVYIHVYACIHMYTEDIASHI